MYDENKSFDPKSAPAKAVKRVLNLLAEVFPEKTPELERYNVISLYCVVADLQRQYVIDEIKPYLNDWFIGFETERREQEAKAEDDSSADPEWLSYKEKISHSTDAADSIRFRIARISSHSSGIPTAPNRAPASWPAKR
jgi:hypothetical protein